MQSLLTATPSTVSKILRQKEKYLFPDNGSLSLAKRAAGKLPDIDRALANWVQNSEKYGIQLTDASIKEKARFFAATLGISGQPTGTGWLEKFKLKNGIGEGKPLQRTSDINVPASDSAEPQEHRKSGRSGHLPPELMQNASKMRGRAVCAPSVACKKETSEPDIKKETDLVLSRYVRAATSTYDG